MRIYVKDVNEINMSEYYYFENTDKIYANCEERYICKPISITKYFILMEITIIQGTIKDMCFGKPTPYKRCFLLDDIGRDIKLWKEVG